MSGFGKVGKGVGRVEVRVKWDPNPLGSPPSDLDIVAGTYEHGAPGTSPAYLVHFDSRAPDGTIWLNRDSHTGKGLGWDEVMTLDFERLSESYDRVVVGVAIQQRPVRLEFGRVLNPAYQVVEGYEVLAEGGFAAVTASTAAVLARFARGESGAWEFHAGLEGYDAEPDDFVRVMGDSHL